MPRLCQGWRNFFKVRIQIVDNFGKIVSGAHKNLENQNVVLGSYQISK
jgi:hypothetical protein